MKKTSLSGTPSDWMSSLPNQPVWDSLANKLFPTNLMTALYWANWLRTHSGDLVSAVSRGVSYFLNGVDLTGDSNLDLDAKDHYIDLLEDKHQILQQLLTIGLNLQFYGNSFTSAIRPVTRVIVCPKCETMRYLSSLERGVDYDYKKSEFTSKCACGYSGKFKNKAFADKSSTRGLRLVHWNPLNINLDHCHITGEERIVYTPDEHDKSFIENEDESVALETLPDTILQAFADDMEIVFKDQGCLHLSLPADAMNSSEMGGWGVPAFLPCFKYVVMMMLLECQTEASVKDYILPIRLLFPDPAISRGGSDPMAMSTNVMHMAQFRSDVERALKNQSMKKSSWHLIPSAVQQIQLGGDGKGLVPVELLNWCTDQILNSWCIPAEFTRTSLLSASSNPPSFKLFEQFWERPVSLLDRALNWYLDQCKQLLAWPAFTGRLLRQSIVSDPGRQQLMFNLQQAGSISMTTLLKSINIDPKQENKRLLEDQIKSQKLQMEIENRLNKLGMLNSVYAQQTDMNMQNAMAAASGQGGAPQGGAPAPQGAPAGAPPMQGGAPAPGMPPMDPIMAIQNLQTVVAPNNATPDQLQADAQTVASILMSTPIGAPRNRIYSMVKQLNPTLYDVSKSVLQQIEQQARQQGLEAARQGGM